MTTAENYSGVFGIYATTSDGISPIDIDNSSGIDVTTAGNYSSALGIDARTVGDGSPIEIVNSGDIGATTAGNYSYALGIFARTVGASSPISIRNSGNIFASGLYSTGAFAFSLASDIVIVNAGSISASSFRATDTYGGSTDIFNTGRITGFVDLTDSPDCFFNQAGGVFDAVLTSYFGDGNDLFRNEESGTVLVTPKTHEAVFGLTRFIGLERFDNRGLITMQNGQVGDAFRISNVSGAQDDYFFDSGIVFNGGGNSTLAVDTFLGGPGSASDIFIIDGDVTGKTALAVNNTNAGAGVFNPEGIPVVFVGGNVKSDAFFLAQPIDTGFFNYDLLFKPTGSGFFDLRSFPGGGALLLPQLVTAAQDIWHAGSSTWFDRTADLRVLLNGGVAPAAYDPALNSANGMAQGAAMTPAVWARGSGAWLDREASQR